MKPYFIIALIILSASVIGSLFVSSDLVLLFLFAELATLVSFYMFFSVSIPSLFPEHHTVDENFNCGANEAYLRAEEAYAPTTPFGGVDNK
jgi:hypothetical protein